MIRFAAVDDIPRLLELGAAMHAESQWESVPFSVEKVEQLYQMLIGNEDALFIVAERDNKIIGMMAGTVQEHWMSEARVACDLFVFIEPAHRGGITGPRMLDLYTGWSLNKNVGLIMLGAMTGVAPQKTARLFGLLGYEQMGTMHRYVRTD